MINLKDKSIALIIPDFDFGGEEKRAVFFANNYLDHFKEVHLISPSGGSNALLDPRVKHFEIGVRGYKKVFKILSFLKSNNIHFFQGHKRATLPYLFLAEKVHGIHSLFNFDNIYLKGNGVYKLISPKNLAYLSDVLKDFYQPYYPNKNNVTINMGGDFYEMASTAEITETRKSLGLNEDDFVILSLGRLSEQKNHKLLIDALQKCEDINFKCLVVGTGPDREVLESAVDLAGLSDKVKFLGHRTDVANLVNAAQLLVQSSVFEGFPNALIEAASVGLPFVATNVGSTRTLVQDNAVLVDSEDKVQLARGIHEIFANYNRYKDAAMKFKDSEFFKQFHKDKMLTNYISYYRSL